MGFFNVKQFLPTRAVPLLYGISEVKWKSKSLSLETKNTQKNAIRRLGFIKSLYVQQSNLWSPCLSDIQF